jgi:hypothetical protein
MLASKAVLKMSGQFKVDRKKVIASLINRYPDPALRTVALVLLKHSRIDGKSSKAVAAALLYLAGVITGNEVSQMSVAKFFGTHEAVVRTLLASKVVDVGVVKSKIGIPLLLEVPRELCRELEKFAQLSPKVVCT